MNIDANAVYVPKNADELRDNWLRDVRLEALEQGIADPPIEPGTDLYIRATANANADLIQYANIAISDASTSVLSATGEALEDKRKAYGLPEVKPSPSTGKIVVSVIGGGTAPMTTSTQFVFPNGKRGKVAFNTTVADGGTVSVVAIDTGADTNLAAGQTVRFVVPPLNVKTNALVATGGLTGGLDEESDDRKRARILNELGHLRAGGNWSEKIAVALGALANLRYAFDYPALGGPGSEKVVLMIDFDVANNVYSRQVSAGDVIIVQGAMDAAFPEPFELRVQSVSDQPVDVSLILTLPSATLEGWQSTPVWPLLVVGDNNRVTITTYAGGVTVTVNAGTAIAPPNPTETQIAWWSQHDMSFNVRTIQSFTGAAGAWVLTLDAPFIDSLGNVAAVGDFVSPAAVNMGNYGDSWITALGTLGPGENTHDPSRLPPIGRSNRKPVTAEMFPSDLTSRLTDAIESANPEIGNITYGYQSAVTPTTPGVVQAAPYVLTPRHFAIYSS